MARGSTSKTLVWILMALLIFGLGGFGVTNLSGNLRNVGTVGEKPITVTAYGRALQQDLRALQAQTGTQISFNEARALGLDRVALARLIASRALDHETAELGISIGDENLAKQLLDVRSFQGVNGKFDREAYKFALQQTGLSETEYEILLREETSRGLLEAAILTNTPASTTYADTLIAYIAEQRGFTWAGLGADDLATPLAAPTDAQLASYHGENAADFTLPEIKRLTYTWLSPDMIIDTVDVDETAMRDEYDARSDEFNKPERRLIERLPFADLAAANAAKASLETGKTFDDLVTDRGLSLGDVDLGDVVQSELDTAGTGAGTAAFAANSGDVVGPFETNLGPALFRINGVLPARITSFADATAQLRDELAGGRARNLIDTQSTEIDELLAGGATLEDVAAETDMQLKTLDWAATIPGTDSDSAAGYAAFQTAANDITADDFPQIIALADGGIIAMRLDETLAPRLQTLNEVRADVISAWTVAQTTTALLAQAETLAAQITPETDIAGLGVTATIETETMRSEYITGTPRAFLDAVFEMQPGETRVVPGIAGSIAIALVVRLDTIDLADETSQDVIGARASLQQQASAGQSQDLFQFFITDVQNRAGLQIDQNAINAVNANFQ